MTLETLIPLKARTGVAALAFAAVVLPLPAAADGFMFSTGNPDGRMATATRPESAGKIQIETADDFVLTAQTSITQATFTGLLCGLLWQLLLMQRKGNRNTFSLEGRAAARAPGSVAGHTVQTPKLIP